ncbi:hypothetical protein [Blastococcus atacamensis]|uniref:hypothetical protein n=1 Tax=Blastococcus atacamensis TaxID=2070508 RepID=UPI000CECD569|nr:hypothetical protein [Blastococcus atacamensis]
MGASGRDHVVEYRGDPATALRELREEVLASGDFLWEENSGRYQLLLFTDGRRTHIAFWSASGD